MDFEKFQSGKWWTDEPTNIAIPRATLLAWLKISSTESWHRVSARICNHVYLVFNQYRDLDQLYQFQLSVPVVLVRLFVFRHQHLTFERFSFKRGRGVCRKRIYIPRCKVSKAFWYWHQNVSHWHKYREMYWKITTPRPAVMTGKMVALKSVSGSQEREGCREGKEKVEHIQTLALTISWKWSPVWFYLIAVILSLYPCLIIIMSLLVSQQHFVYKSVVEKLICSLKCNRVCCRTGKVSLPPSVVHPSDRPVIWGLVVQSQAWSCQHIQIFWSGVFFFSWMN